MPMILVIDDEPTLRRLLGKVLQTAGYRTAVAENGTEGLGLLQSTLVDALICDLQLPDISGVEVCRAIEAWPEYATLPIILMSGGSVAPARSECRYTQFMRKPFQPSSLVSRLKQLVATDSGLARELGRD